MVFERKYGEKDPESFYAETHPLLKVLYLALLARMFSKALPMNT